MEPCKGDTVWCILRSMAQSFCDVHLHLVFSTKHREALIDPAFEERLYAYIGGIAKASSCPLLAAGGMSDHVHLLVGLHPSVASSHLVRDIKANSSGWVKKEFGVKFAWQSGGGTFGVGHGDLPRVKGYIAKQKEHHRVQTFQEEFLEFLARAKKTYDPRYIWD